MHLTPRQAEVLELAARGLRDKEIAVYLGISRRTIEDRFAEMRERTGTRTRAELVARAVEAGLVRPVSGVPPTDPTAGTGRSRGPAQRHKAGKRSFLNRSGDGRQAGASPPNPKGAVASHAGKDVALAFRLIEESARAWQFDHDYSLARTREAVRLLGPDAVLAILNLQDAGKFPMCGTPEWDRLVDLAEDGKVTVSPVFLIGDDDYACEDVVETRVRGESAASTPPASMSLRDGFRSMGLL